MKLTGIAACPVCASTATAVLYRGIRDHSPLHLTGISICICTSCRHQFLFDPPLELLKEFYVKDMD